MADINYRIVVKAVKNNRVVKAVKNNRV